MLLRRVSAAAMPVPLQDVMNHLRHPQDDQVYIDGIRRAAHDVVAEMSGRSLGTETWAVSFSEAAGDLVLPKSPVQSITSISYFDAAGAVQAASVADYLLFAGQDRAMLRPAEGRSWPTLQRREDALTITFVAGYIAMPEALRVAVLMAAECIFDRVPFAPAMDVMIASHRLGWIAA